MTISEIIKKLDNLRCGEPHNTGFGCCRCETNDLIDEIVNDLEDFLMDLEDEASRRDD